MLCGVEWWAYITRNNAYRIAKLFDLDRKIGSKVKRERRIDDNEHSWIRVGKAECFFIEVRKLNRSQFELSVRGSLHKFFHGDNKGAFSGTEILGAIEAMSNLFEVQPSDMVVKNFEVGVNLSVPFIVFPYLKNNLIYHRKVLKQEMREKGVGFIFDHKNYLIKYYQKDLNLLRFEIKFKSKEKFQAYGISTIEDFQRTSIKKLVDHLQPEFSETDMRGEIDIVDAKNNPNNLTDKERRKLLQFSSIYYQQGHRTKLEAARERENRKLSATLQKRANRLRNACKEIIRAKGDGIQEALEAMIQEKVEVFKKEWV